MKAALLIVLSLSAVALAGPAFNKNNQINSQDPSSIYKKQQQDTTYTAKDNDQTAKGPVVDILKQWCSSSQMSQQELTSSFKKLVSAIKSKPTDEATEQAVMNERVCSASSQKSDSTETDAQAHELIKDVYMDALIACKSRDCNEKLLQIIKDQSDKVDTIRASYYMTRLAVTEKDQIKSTDEIKSVADAFISQSRQQQQQQPESVERQQLFAVTSMVGKYCQYKPQDQEAKQIAQQVAKTILERFVKPVSQQEVEQYRNSEQNTSEQIVKKIAKRNAALKALANLPGNLLKDVPECEQELQSIAQNKQELTTSRQSAIECLEQNDKAQQTLKQITFDQEEPTEVRVAAYRALMTVVYSPESENNNNKQESAEQTASQIIEQIIKHCEDSRNQQQDEQFVLYAISHLDNMRSSQQPEHQTIKECIAKNKQHYMKIQVLNKKFKQQLSDVRRSSRNYKLEQEFNQIESGLIVEGDVIYEDNNNNNNNNKQQQQRQSILPKLVRVNMSMPVMGETVNVVEITLRQNQMDEEVLSALKMVVDSTKFTSSNSVSNVVNSFKSTVEKHQTSSKSQDKACEADLTIKIDGTCVVYVSADDFKTSSNNQHRQHRNTRSANHYSSSLVEDVIAYLKRSPINFNRGINFSLNERIAKLLDVEANLIAGLRFTSRAQGHSSDEFEIVARAEPRFNFEAIVGPAKISSKKLLQRFSTKSAMGLRLRFKRDELVDVQLDLPMQSMELFTVETQIVEKSSKRSDSYNYLPESIYGQEDIYSSSSLIYPSERYPSSKNLAKRSIFDSNPKTYRTMLSKLAKGKQVSHSFETSEKFARATGLRGQLRFAAAPKDMSFLVSCSVEKYEPIMQGYRLQIQKSPSAGPAQKSYLIQVSTPGSRTNRQMQVTYVEQSSSQRTLIKSTVQMSDKYSASFMTEMIHDGRQYAIKTELVSRSQRGGQPSRHYAEAGVMIQGAKSPVSGRAAQYAYQPYVQISSTSLKRPLELQGAIAYSQSPKSVISYELKCPTSGDYIQGKLIVDQRQAGRQQANNNNNKFTTNMNQKSNNSYRLRRSMQSPLELVLSNDLTLTNELTAQVQKHAVKVHNMIQWSAQKIQLQADFTGSYKDMRKQQETPSTVSCQMNLDAEQQLVVIERESARKSYRATIKSDWRAPAGHQMLAEIRYGQNKQQLVAYNHKIDIQQVSAKQYEIQMQVEFADSKRSVQEKYQGRARVSTERKQKSVQAELSSASRQQVAKVEFEYQSLAKHDLTVYVQTQRFMHQCELRNNQNQFSVSSRTDKEGQTYAKFVVEYAKQSSAKQAKILAELPYKRSSVAVDLKLASGERSSVAIQTPRFVSSGEFSFETISRPFFGGNKQQQSSSSTGFYYPSANLRFRNQIKDLASKQAYWMDSALNAADWNKESSYFRFESPIYRTDVEYDPRDKSTKFGAFALRSKRSIRDDEELYSNKNSILNEVLSSHSVSDLAKLSGLGQNKLWMMRALFASPYARDQIKQQATRALFQYVDRQQQHHHSVDYKPRQDQWASFNLDYSPNTEFQSGSTFEPMHFNADLASSYSRPSTASFESEYLSADIDAKPFDSDESYAKISALSRHRRSPFAKHESEWRYKKDEGHKAWMKHTDSKGSRHEMRAESERNPAKWAKMSYESPKHGKGSYEHQWRKHVTKRSSSSMNADNNNNNNNDDVYANKIQYQTEGPQHNQWKHESQFEWMEPRSMIKDRRYRRSIYNQDQDKESSSYLSKFYSPAEYLRHTSARLSSAYSSPVAVAQNEQTYKLDFDYQPQLSSARFDFQMPEEMKHSSSFEMKPEDRVYKLQSKLYNRRTKDSVYDFSAQTKPYVSGLASADQEPVFVHTQHPMLERPISQKSLIYSLFKQPMKLDYQDKYGRQASFDYDQLPASTSSRYPGLRQKRAAVYYKDSDSDFEHSSTYDFYPETFIGRVKPSYYSQKQMSYYSSDDVVVKTQTKYGPVVVRADTSDANSMQFQLESPVVQAKVSVESGANMRKLIKFHVDNKSQRVQLVKLLRQKAPESIASSKLVERIARKVDSARFEHGTEVLVSMIDSYFKIKSQTELNSRPVLNIDGEWNQQQGKAYAKLNGERCDGKIVVDLIRKSAELVMDAQLDKHSSEPIHHESRLMRTSDNFYTLQSTTTYKSRPVFKLVGKISSMIFEDPAHLLYSGRHRNYNTNTNQDSHISTFEAHFYEPKQYQITGVFDCDKKEARIVSKSLDEDKVQETLIKFDERSETLYFDSRLASLTYPAQSVYSTKAKLSLPGLYKSDKCYSNDYNRPQRYTNKTSSPSSCASELVYEDKSGFYATKYQPNEYVSISTPRGKQAIKLNY